jgi:CDP-diglyceride synthetase
MENEKKSSQKVTLIVMGILTAAIVLYAAYALITKNLSNVIFGILLGLFIIAYTLLTDVYEPYRQGMFEHMTIGQRTGLTKIFVADVVGVAALLYGVIGMGKEEENSVLFPVLVYFLAMQMKRKFRPEFEGITESAEEDSEESVEENSEEKNE